MFSMEKGTIMNIAIKTPSQFVAEIEGIVKETHLVVGGMLIMQLHI